MHSHVSRSSWATPTLRAPSVTSRTSSPFSCRRGLASLMHCRPLLFLWIFVFYPVLFSWRSTWGFRRRTWLRRRCRTRRSSQLPRRLLQVCDPQRTRTRPLVLGDRAQLNLYRTSCRNYRRRTRWMSSWRHAHSPGILGLDFPLGRPIAGHRAVRRQGCPSASI